MGAGTAALLATVSPGCHRSSGYLSPDLDDQGDRATAAYYRDQVRQVFGTDLVRVEPLREASITADEYSKLRRQLDLREVASRAPRPGPAMAAREFTTHDWESDRPAPRPAPAAAPEPRQSPIAARSAHKDGANAGVDPAGAGDAVPEPFSRQVDMTADPNSTDRGSPWDAAGDKSRQRRALARQTAETGTATDPSVPAPLPTPASGSEPASIDPAIAALVLSDAPTLLDESAFPASDGRASDRPSTSPAGGSGWSIVIAVFNGDEQAALARQALAEIQTDGRLPEAFIQERGRATAICVGSYPGAEDRAAQSDLHRIQTMEFTAAGGATKPYATVYLAPPIDAAPVKNEYDLRTAKRTFGKDALYTLQVGFYGREEVNRLSPEDKKTVQAAAEEAAAQLRREGELAFFYHGPNRSMVTVGVFGPEDFNPMNPGNESRRLRDARRRHPLNLYNGQGYTGKTPGMREAKLVPSALVAVPER